MPSVFISHNRRDKEIAEKIAEALEFEDIKPRIDSWEVSPGDSFVQWMDQAIEESKILILVWSKNAKESRWVGREWASFLPKVVKDKTMKIIPIVIDGTHVPDLLQDIVRINYTGNLLDVVRGVNSAIFGTDKRRTHREMLAEAQADAIMNMRRGIPLPYVACPKCGSLKLGTSIAGGEYGSDFLVIRCQECEFSDLVEITPTPVDDEDHFGDDIFQAR